jgi:hypothetical protein
MFAGLLVGVGRPEALGLLVGGKPLVGGKRGEDPGVERREVLVVFFHLSSGDVRRRELGLLVGVQRREVPLVNVRHREPGLLVSVAIWTSRRRRFLPTPSSSLPPVSKWPKSDWIHCFTCFLSI